MKIKYLILIMLLLLISGCFKPATSAQITNSGFEYQTVNGFTINKQEMYLGASSNTNVFDLENIVINLHYGVTDDHAKTRYYTDSNLEKYDLYFGLYALTSSEYNTNLVQQTNNYLELDNHSLLKELTEYQLFETDEYRCTINDQVKYSKVEQFTINKELFTEESGYLKLYFYAFYESFDEEQQTPIYKYYNSQYVTLKYTLISDNKVEIEFDM